MKHFTAKKFKLKFGVKAGEFFDLTKHLTPMHKVELMRNPTVSVVRAEFGTMSYDDFEEKLTEIHYMLKVQWWLQEVQDEMRIRGLITDVCIFDDLSEMEEYKAEYALMEKPLNNN